MYYIYEVTTGCYEDMRTYTYFIKVPVHQSLSQFGTTLKAYISTLRGKYTSEDEYSPIVVFLGSVPGEIDFTPQATVLILDPEKGLVPR